MSAGRIATLRLDLIAAAAKLTEALNWRAGYELQADSYRAQAAAEEHPTNRAILHRAEIQRRSMAQQMAPVIEYRRRRVAVLEIELKAAELEESTAVPLPRDWAQQCAGMDDMGGVAA